MANMLVTLEVSQFETSTFFNFGNLANMLAIVVTWEVLKLFPFSIIISSLKSLNKTAEFTGNNTGALTTICVTDV